MKDQREERKIKHLAGVLVSKGMGKAHKDMEGQEVKLTLKTSKTWPEQRGHHLFVKDQRKAMGAALSSTLGDLSLSIKKIVHSIVAVVIFNPAFCRCTLIQGKQIPTI